MPQETWTPIPPQSTNGWGQFVQGQLIGFRRELDILYDRLSDYIPGRSVEDRIGSQLREMDQFHERLEGHAQELEEHRAIMRRMRREMLREVAKAVDRKHKTSAMISLMNWMTENWRPIAAALFFVTAAISKTGRLPNPLELIDAVLSAGQK